MHNRFSRTLGFSRTGFLGGIISLLGMALLVGCGGGGGGGSGSTVTGTTDTSTSYTISGSVELPASYSATATAKILAAVPSYLTAKVVDSAGSLVAGPVSVNATTGQFTIPNVKPGTNYRVLILTSSGKIILQKFYDALSASKLSERLNNESTAVAILVQHSNGSRSGTQVEVAVSGGQINLSTLTTAIDSFLRGLSNDTKTDITDIVKQAVGESNLTGIVNQVPAAGGTGTTTSPASGTSGTGTSGTGTGSSSSSQYSLTQAMSDNAQLSTIAFSGLAFITGSAGADTFFPPGKVADFFGFQYMRDVDTAGYGHNTTFLSRVANNVLYILDDTQKAKLIGMAKTQSSIYVNFAYNRFPLMNAFRRSLEGKGPTSTSTLSKEAVAAYTGRLYQYDAELSYNRAVMVGEIVNSFTADQKAYLAKMSFNNYLSWPDVAEDLTLKKSMTNTEFVAVMTYASELFSWYKGNVDADIYFCPERHGTYFGGFFMKDYPAMGDSNYFISTAITGDSGQGFLNVLNVEQKTLITGIIEEQRAALTEIAQIRTTVSNELRKVLTGGTIDKAMVYAKIQRYGELDGQMSAIYAIRFSQVNKTLTDSQRAALVKLRNLTVVPTGAYCFATAVSMPTVPNTDYLFGIGTMPLTAGQDTAPSGFSL